jgi:hypothetical protein
MIELSLIEDIACLFQTVSSHSAQSLPLGFMNQHAEESNSNRRNRVKMFCHF